jgi:D-alanine-D-alanine ligase
MSENDEKRDGLLVAVPFGGRSPEHDVSIITALASVIPPLRLLGHRVMPIYIAKDGRWFSDPRLANIKTYQDGTLETVLETTRPLRLEMDGTLTLVQQKSRWKKARRVVDLVFPALHGTYGEDGSLMGLLRMAGVPFVGCDMAASAVAMDKVLSKDVVRAAGLLTPEARAFSKAEWVADPEGILEGLKKLGLPLFVKPPHLGSSIGITRVEKFAELGKAIDVALFYDSRCLVERAVENLTEVTVPIIGNDELTPGMVERPLNKGEFFDFEAKYLNNGKGGKGGKKTGSGNAQGYSELPAVLPDGSTKGGPKGLYQECEALAVAAYRAIGCAGIARIDLLVDGKAKKVYFNEVNPLPGSLYAHNFAAAGMSKVDLVGRLVELAFERAEQESGLERAFATSYLRQF